MTPPEAGEAAGTRRWLPFAGLIVGAWALLPRWTGPFLDTEDRVEIVDHVVPGVVVLVVAVTVLILSRRPGGLGGTALFVAGMVISLAGLWMTATHVPLVVDALGDNAPWGATVFHTTPGLAVLALGLAWTAAYWSDIETDDDDAASSSSAA